MNYLVVDISGKVLNYDIALCESMLENLLPNENLLLMAANIDANKTSCNTRKLLSIVPKSLQNSERKIKRVAKALEGFLNYIYLVLYVCFKRPSVIHFQWFPFLEVCSVEKIFLKLIKNVSPKSRILLTVHNIFPHNSSVASRERYRKRFALVEKFVDKFVLHLQTSKLQFCEEFRIEESRCKVIAHGTFEPKNLTVYHRMRGEQLHFVMYGNQSYYKGTDILVDAIGLLPPTFQKQVRVSIVGKTSEEYLSVLQKKSEGLNIKFIPEFVPDEKLYDVILESDIIVLPYREISQSGVLLLALFFERPVICSDLPSFKETLVGYGNDLFFEKGNAQSLACVIGEIFSPSFDWNFYKSKVAALKLKYSWKNISKEVINLYKEE